MDNPKSIINFVSFVCSRALCCLQAENQKRKNHACNLITPTANNPCNWDYLPSVVQEQRYFVHSHPESENIPAHLLQRILERIRCNNNAWIMTEPDNVKIQCVHICVTRSPCCAVEIKLYWGNNYF